MIEVIFLVALALIWILFSVAADFKHRIVPNWLNFSLIIFALGFRFFYSLFNGQFDFFYQGIVGLGIFFIIGNGLYYGRMFAGGDAKLMIALGAILPFSTNFTKNLETFSFFFLLFLFSGAIYGFSYSLALTIRDFKKQKKELSKQFEKNKKFFLFSTAISIILLTSAFYEIFLFYLGILSFFIPFLYIYAKAVDETSLIKKIKTKELTEGDWLHQDLKIGNKKIKSNWGGLTSAEIKLIRKKFKEVKIRQGIPFTPSFLIAFILLIYFYFNGIGLWDFLY
ncbi:MAG: A24 family peptidase [Nanoarchaeota archaeon]